MTIPHFLDQMDYTLWANRRAIQSLKDLSASGIEIPQRAIQVMSHVVAALHIWYARVTGQSDVALPVWGELTLDEMTTRNEGICAMWVDFLRTKSDTDLAKESFTYKNSLGQGYTNTLLEIVTHFPIHSEHHRGQIAQMVRLAGGTPVNTDYIQFAREEHTQAA
jgi:uncharacterized damage-inducible protein DinB